MAGVVKRKYESETRRLQKSFTRPLNLISEVLPDEYDKYLLLKLFKELFPLMWDSLIKRYEQYESKDKFLAKVGKKKRYYHDKPDVFFFKLPKVKHMVSQDQRARHKKKFNEKNAQLAYQSLMNKANSKAKAHENKMASINKDLQTVDPLYIDAFLSAYHKRGITTQGKVEIFNELKKYNTTKVIEFFQKLNDSERNNQVRRMAFEHLQKLGASVRLRKNFKGKVKSYNIETDRFIVSPEDLYQRLELNTIQNEKKFHVFISHSYKDADLLRQVKSCLNNHDLSVYCDWTSDNDFLKRNLVSDYTKMVLKKRIEQSRCVVFLQTKNSVNTDNSFTSPWVSLEIEHALSIGKPIYSFNFTNDSAIFKQVKYFINNGIEIDDAEANKIRT
ncbi:TIR domain-containing protein [Vibrio cholerae]|uniref:toll/interleukin-1 receptor domain-containing protein n=1 Tax=Vibrio cholerae TaxID=666 RepID=UPI002DBA6306|nr:toll/interleukin-1 receptor domain-containing protein [Vibrio cholerae]EKF9882605.1 toll/interleukin-1 receptor domain-containing protein [Vibrio cholerae]MEB5557775.1 TIR domain-containing protein [Vibrio cholerae]